MTILVLFVAVSVVEHASLLCFVRNDCVYVCSYAYVCMYLCLCVSTSVYMELSMQMHVAMHTYTLYVHTYTHESINTYISAQNQGTYAHAHHIVPRTPQYINSKRRGTTMSS
jgi:hypothetical protein